MNALIEELAEYASHQSPDGYPVTIPYSKDFIREFAKLIIEECMEVCESATEEGQPLHLVSLGYAQRIKDHFGMEE